MISATFHEKAEATHEILSNRQNIRRYLKTNDIHLDQLTRLINRMSAVREELVEEAEALEAERKEKAKKVEEAKRLLKENGISIEDIVQTERGNGIPRKARGRRSDAGKPKSNPLGLYEYEDKDGKKQQIELRRVGRPPEDFSAYLQKTGKQRKDCLVKQLEPDNPATGNAEAKEAAKAPEADKKQEASKKPETAKSA